MPIESLDLWLDNAWNNEFALRVKLRDRLASVTTPFQRIDVYDSYVLGRILALGGSIVLSEVDEATYSEGLTHPALACHPDPKQVLVLGGGDGGVSREIARYAGVEQITVVEIDKQLVELCREYFPRAAAGLDEPRVNVCYDDSHRFLTSTDQRYDIIIVDGEQMQDPSSDLVQERPFANLLADHCADGGIVIVPLGLVAFAGEQCRSSLAQLRERFAQTHVYTVTTPSVAGYGWAVAWCSDSREPVVSEAPETSLEYWEAAIQPALFALPRRTRRVLGME